MTETSAVPGLTPEAPPAPVVNLATNPSFEAASGVIEVRRNLCLNPNVVPGGAGFGSVNSGVNHKLEPRVPAPSPAPNGATSANKVYSINAATGTEFASIYNADGLSNTGPARTISAAFYPDVAASIILTGGATPPTVNIPGGVWTVLSWDVPANVHTGFRASRSDGQPAGTAALYWTEVAACELPGPFFHGGTPAAGDFAYSWVGAVNNSASMQTGASIVTWSGRGPSSRTRAISSSEWSSNGAKSIRIIPAYTSRGSGYVEIASVSIPSPLVAGRTYTVIAKCRIETPQGFSVPGSARCIRLITTGTGMVASDNVYSTAPDVPGVHELRLTVEPSEVNPWYLRLYNGGMRGDPHIWFDDLLIVEGEYDGPYFDGDSAAAIVPGSPNRHAYAWDGTPHSPTSTSTRTSAGPSSWSREWWESLPLAYRVAERDEVGGYPLMRYMDGPGSVAGRIRTINDDMWDGAYTDPARVPDGKPLRWLAMLLGIKAGGDDVDLRARMVELVAAGRSPAGTRSAIADATRPYLLGSRQVQVGPDKTTTHKIIVQVRADEVPPEGLAWVAAQVQRAGVAPAGHLVVLVAATSTWDAWSAEAGASWDEKEVNIPTWLASDSAGVVLE